MTNIVIPFGTVIKCRNKYVEVYLKGSPFGSRVLFKKHKKWKLSKKASIGQYVAMCPDGTVIYASTDDADRILRNARTIEDGFGGIL